jgi:malate dehydrogenase (oxaloacetate-decarboxylating)(NADP+)
MAQDASKTTPLEQSSQNAQEKKEQLRLAALEYHQFPTPGKISVTPTKQLLNQHDLALAYSPGVAAPCEEIVKDQWHSRFGLG